MSEGARRATRIQEWKVGKRWESPSDAHQSDTGRFRLQQDQIKCIVVNNTTAKS